MKPQKFLAGLLIGGLAFNQLGIAFAATDLPFSDVAANNPYVTAIVFLKNKGIINGYPDGTFKPDQVVNRAESAKMIMGIQDLKYWDRAQDAIFGGADTYVDSHPFSDVTDKNAWYYPYVKDAWNNGMVQGYPDGTFKPEQTVNRAENLKMLLNHTFLRIDSLDGVDPYVAAGSDTTADAWYSKYVEYAIEKNIIWPDANGNIHPADGMTRGKLAEAIYKVYLADEHMANQWGADVHLDSQLQKFVVTKTDLNQTKIAELPGTFTANDEIGATIKKITANNAYVSVCATGLGGYILYEFCAGDTYQVNLSTGVATKISGVLDAKGNKLENFMDVSADEKSAVWVDDTDHSIAITTIPAGATVQKSFPVDNKYGQFGSVKFSDDGQHLAYAAAIGDPQNEASVVLSIDISTGNQTQVAQNSQVYYVYGWQYTGDVDYGFRYTGW